MLIFDKTYTSLANCNNSAHTNQHTYIHYILILYTLCIPQQVTGTSDSPRDLTVVENFFCSWGHFLLAACFLFFLEFSPVRTRRVKGIYTLLRYKSIISFCILITCQWRSCFKEHMLFGCLVSTIRYLLRSWNFWVVSILSHRFFFSFNNHNFVKNHLFLFGNGLLIAVLCLN